MATKKKTNPKKSGGKIVSRPKPSAPRAGVVASGRRYECGGKMPK